VKTGEDLEISYVLQLHSLLALDDDALQRKSPPVKEFKCNTPAKCPAENILINLLEKDSVNGYKPKVLTRHHPRQSLQLLQ